MQKEFYVSYDGIDDGPFSMDKILEKVKSRELIQDDYVFVEKEDAWVKIRDYAPLAEKLPKEMLTQPLSGTEVESPTKASKTNTGSVTPPAFKKENTSGGFTAKKKGEKSNPGLKTEAKGDKGEKAEKTGSFSKKEKTNTTLNVAQLHKLVRSGVVKIVNGQGTISISNNVAEKVKIRLEDHQKLGLTTDAATEVTFSAGKASQFVVTGPLNATAGKPVTLTIEAQDDHGNVDRSFRGEVQVITTGNASGGGLVKLANGVGSVSIANKKAEKIEVSLQDVKNTGLEVFSAHDVSFSPGAASQFVIVEAPSAVAGAPVTIRVEARDEFGNVDVGFQGSVSVNAEGSAVSLGELEELSEEEAGYITGNKHPVKKAS